MKRLLLFSAATAAVFLTTAPTALAAIIHGTYRSETLIGTREPDVVLARGGDDAVFGRGSPDVLFGQRGNDRVHGGWGSDVASGGPGNDQVAGASGSDVVSGNRGDDSLAGDGGDDRIFAGWGADTLSGGDGDDVLFALARDRQADRVDCGPGRDAAFIRSEDSAVNCETTVTLGAAAAPTPEHP
jgi:Ca2+-binding RTX toxin-like protein